MNYILFYKSKHPFSNWYPSIFVHDGVTFNCSEQYMMYQKAMLFDDIEVAQLILEQTEPRNQKFLGRQVRNFDNEIWMEECVRIMVEGLVCKFTQNKYLEEFLLNTGEALIAEASPTDKIWGIGLEEDDPRAQDSNQWKGENLLGIALMRARRFIRELNSDEKLSKS